VTFLKAWAANFVIFFVVVAGLSGLTFTFGIAGHWLAEIYGLWAFFAVLFVSVCAALSAAKAWGEI
jgi:hypothetical protein